MKYKGRIPVWKKSAAATVAFVVIYFVGVAFIHSGATDTRTLAACMMVMGYVGSGLTLIFTLLAWSRGGY